MFCTGGIRCEKASVYLKRKGFKNIFLIKRWNIELPKKLIKNKVYGKGVTFLTIEFRLNIN